MPEWVFLSWESLARTLVSGLGAYVALVALLRVSGKRTLSKMNAFDFVVTVAFGSLLATITLSRSVPLTDGVLALVLLVLVQYVVTWLSVRSRRFQRLIKASPTLLMIRGRLIDEALVAQRVTEEEVYAAIRNSGAVSPDEIGAVVLETEGTLTVLHEIDPAQGPGVLGHVTNPEDLESPGDAAQRGKPPPGG